MDSDAVQTLNFSGACRSALHADRNACATIDFVIQPANVTIRVVPLALWRLPYFRGMLKWHGHREEIYEPELAAFRVLLQALYLDSRQAWHQLLASSGAHILPILALSKKYGFGELEEEARLFMRNHISSQTVWILADYLDACPDERDGDMCECRKPNVERELASAIVSWVRTRKDRMAYALAIEYHGHRLPSWCLLQLLRCAGSESRRAAIRSAVWRRNNNFRLRHGNIVLTGWDAFLHRLCRSSIDGAVNIPDRLDGQKTVRLRRHHSDSEYQTPSPRMRRNSAPDNTLVYCASRGIGTGNTCHVPWTDVLIDRVLDVHWRDGTHYGFTDSVPFRFTTDDGIERGGTISVATDIRDTSREYRIIIALYHPEVATPMFLLDLEGTVGMTILSTDHERPFRTSDHLVETTIHSCQKQQLVQYFTEQSLRAKRITLGLHLALHKIV